VDSEEYEPPAIMMSTLDGNSLFMMFDLISARHELIEIHRDKLLKLTNKSQFYVNEVSTSQSRHFSRNMDVNGITYWTARMICLRKCRKPVVQINKSL
jgi:hypothetical protein